MPVNKCTLKGEPGYKWGQSGSCYTYRRRDAKSRNDAKQKAVKQGIAMGESIREFVDNRGVSLGVDVENGVVRGVKVLGYESRNDRRYAKQAVNDAVSLYEGVRVNIDHGDGNRSYADRFGQLKNVRIVADGLRADLHYNPKHSLAEQFAWDAENAPESVGLSHVAEVKSKRSGKGTSIESIERVLSVDLVADPATTASLFESTGQTEEGTMADKITMETVREDRKLYEDLKREILAEQADSDDAKTKDKKLVEALSRLEVLEAEKVALELEATIDAELKEAKLPEHLVSDVFRSHISKIDAEARKALIAERVELAKGSFSKAKSTEQVHESTVYSKDAKGFAAAFVN